MEKVEKDFEELLQLFNKYKVRYCVVGAFAVAFHAVPRYTKDLDILVDPSLENAERILEALRKFGFGGVELNPEDFAEEGRVVQLGFEPVRIDLITSVKGEKFEMIWKNREKGDLGDAHANFIGLKDLIKSKLLTGRKQDSRDLEVLNIVKERKDKRQKQRAKKRKK